MGIYDSMLVKYGAVMVGYAVLGLPVFGPGKEKYLKMVHNDPARITKDYVRNSSLLINLAKAIGRIVVSYKEI
jgi:ATP-binding cassette subfamily D (ALD) protein 3